MPAPEKVPVLFVSARFARRKAGRNMDGKTNGDQKAARDAQGLAQQQSQGQQEVVGDNSGTYSEEQILRSR